MPGDRYTREAMSKLSDYELMTYFIPKNKIIFAGIENCETSPTEIDNVNQLREAIENDNPDHPIFSNPHYLIYVMYLLKMKEITANETITLCLYLSALMRYTDKQPVVEENHTHQKASAVHEIKVITGKNREFVASYAQSVINQASEYSESMAEKIISVMKKYPSLPPKRLEWFIVIPFKEEKQQEDTMYYFAQTDNGISTYDRTTQELTIPPMAVREILYPELNPNLQFKSIPVLGSFSIRTQSELHAIHRHPVSFITPLVKSNIKNVHRADACPMILPFHDEEIHGFAGISYTDMDHKLIYNHMIPIFYKLREQFPNLQEMIDTNIESINDLQGRRSSKEKKLEEIIKIAPHTRMEDSPTLTEYFVSAFTLLKQREKAIENDCGVTFQEITKAAYSSGYGYDFFAFDKYAENIQKIVKRNNWQVSAEALGNSMASMWQATNEPAEEKALSRAINCSNSP